MYIVCMYKIKTSSFVTTIIAYALFSVFAVGHARMETETDQCGSQEWGQFIVDANPNLT